MELSSFVVAATWLCRAVGLQQQATYHLVDSSVIGEACVFGVRVRHHPGICPAGVTAQVTSDMLVHGDKGRSATEGCASPDDSPAALLPARHLLHGAVELWLNPVEITYNIPRGLSSMSQHDNAVTFFFFREQSWARVPRSV